MTSATKAFVGGVACYLIACGGTGVKLLDSGFGNCGGACAVGEVCQMGQCVSTCVASGGVLCGALCVNPLDDNANCGRCGVACPSGEACSAGSCAATCATGYDVCHLDGGTFYCANLAGDLANCGSCGHACASTDACSAGVCKMANCPVGQSLCGADGGNPTCSDLNGDNNNCGQCGKACLGGESCLAGKCQSGPTCGNGLTACALADGGIGCIDIQLDPDNCGGCGQSCGVAGVCRSGACACEGIYSQCGAAPALYCAALPLDVDNCGACAHHCVTCEGCAAGVCTAAPNLFFTFEQPAPLDGGLLSSYYNSAGLAVADLNRDGYPDLIVSSSGYSSGVFEIVLGGDGGFSPTVSIWATADTQYYYGQPIAVGDFNGDGIPDVAVGVLLPGDTDAGSYTSAVQVFFGDGTGGFSLSDGGVWTSGPYPLSQEYYLVGVVAGDFDQDGKDDIAVLGEYSGMSVLYQTATGFNTVQVLDAGYQPPYYNYYWSALAVGDLNGDGYKDVVTLDYSGNMVGWLAVDGGLATSPTTLNIGPYNYSNIAMSSDGLVNLINGYSTTSVFTYRYQTQADGSGAFVSAGTYTTYNGAYYYGYGAVTADFNGDGQDDLAALGYGSVLVWLRNDGGYDAPVNLPTPLTNYYYNSLAAAAFNGDFRPDIVVVGYYGTGGILKNNSASCTH